MQVSSIDFTIISPELFLVIATSVILLFDLFASEKMKKNTYHLAQFCLLGTAALVYIVGQNDPMLVFHGQYRHDNITTMLQMTIVILAIFILLYSRDYVRERELPFGEYYVLVLFSILGMLVLVSANSLLSLYLGLEILSLPIYALTALRREQTTCTEAAMKYFIMGAIASGMLLYGMSMLYGATHSIDINTIMTMTQTIAGSEKLILLFGLVFIGAGVMFKLGGVPFHMWIPDVYHGAPASVTLLISTAPKVAAFGLAVRLFVDTMPSLHGQWQQMLIVVSILSMGLGNLVAVVQQNLKRMLAYSSIAHIGYMLLGLLVGTKAGYTASMFYIISYSLMSLGAFAIIILLSRAGIEVENIDDFKGLNQRNPWLAAMMLLLMFSMAGLPPLVGFFAKIAVLEVLVSADLVWLAALALVFAIIGVYYYIRVVKAMYFDKADPSLLPIKLASKDVQLAISANGLLVLVLGLFPSTLFELCKAAF